MNELIDRYVWAVEQRLPQAHRADVTRELRGTIADMVGGREATGGEDPVRGALRDLGDPAEFARGYRTEQRGRASRRPCSTPHSAR